MKRATQRIKCHLANIESEMGLEILGKHIMDVSAEVGALPQEDCAGKLDRNFYITGHY